VSYYHYSELCLYEVSELLYIEKKYDLVVSADFWYVSRVFIHDK